MPLALQAKLLRVLQEQEVEPLGSNQVQRIDVRIIAATFRADLYYRRNVLPTRLPPLRERLDDLEALVETLAEGISRRSGLPHISLNADAMELLARHDWPGNIRELHNGLEQATLMTDDRSLGARHFGALLATVTPPAEVVREAVAPALAAARLLGISRATPYQKLALALAQADSAAPHNALTHPQGD